MFDPNDIDGKVDSHYQNIRKAELNQSDVAKARRTVRERKETYVSMTDELNRQMREAALSGNMNAFKTVAAQAKNLEDLGSKIDDEEKAFNEISQNAIVKRQSRVSDEVKTEIHNLYHAGVSNQTQLAGDYDVSQATVNKIVNDDPSNYRRK
jgi:hypothetical protein